MTLPVQNQSNYYSLAGQRVSTRTYSWEAMVIPQWGDKWKQRQVCYKFSNGRKFFDNDNTKQGIYGIEIVNRILLEGANPSYLDMYQYGIDQEDLTALGQG